MMSNGNEQIVAMHPRKLTSTDNTVNANVIKGLLEERAIPCYVKDLETGNYMNLYMGYSVFGKEIYVDEADYEDAKEVLEGIQNDGTVQDEEIEVPRYKTKKFVARVMIGLMGGSVMIAMVLQLFFA